MFFEVVGKCKEILSLFLCKILNQTLLDPLSLLLQV